MARQLTPFGRILLVVCGLALIGYGFYRYDLLARIAKVVAPDRKAEGTVSKDDGTHAPTLPDCGLSAGSYAVAVDH